MQINGLYIKEEDFPKKLNQTARNVAISTTLMCGSAWLAITVPIFPCFIVALFPILMFVMSITCGLHEYGPSSYNIMRKVKEIRNERTTD